MNRRGLRYNVVSHRSTPELISWFTVRRGRGGCHVSAAYFPVFASLLSRNSLIACSTTSRKVVSLSKAYRFACFLKSSGKRTFVAVPVDTTLTAIISSINTTKLKYNSIFVACQYNYISSTTVRLVLRQKEDSA